MKRILSMMLVTLMAVTVYAAERSLSLKGTIKEIEVSAGVKVYYVPGDGQPRVIISGPQDNISNVEVTLRNGVLHISGKRSEKKKGGLLGLIHSSGVRNLKGVKIMLYAPHVGVLSAGSGAELKVSSPINVPGEAASVKASSGSDVEVEWLTCASLECMSSSGADMEIKLLTAGSVMVTASSGSDIDIEALTANHVNARASSGSDISLGGSANRVNLKASSGSDIDARKLKCPSVNTDKSSGASIKCK